MAISERRKGLRGEREVAAIYRAAGCTVHNLEGAGDHHVRGAGGRTVHGEVKRQERLQLPIWQRQAEAEAPAGTVPAVHFRQSGRPWWVALPLADFAAILAGSDGQT